MSRVYGHIACNPALVSVFISSQYFIGKRAPETPIEMDLDIRGETQKAVCFHVFRKQSSPNTPPGRSGVPLQISIFCQYILWHQLDVMKNIMDHH